MKNILSKIAAHLQLGRRGEDAACQFLKKQGFKILHRNFRCPIGELDVVAIKQERLHFIEIKTRSQDRFGNPEEAVGREKQTKIIRIAQWYSKQFSQETRRMSFDVLAVSFVNGKVAATKFIEGAFLAGQEFC